MYVILAILYESYLHPITVLSTLPTAIIGGLATLMFFHEEVSLYGMIGLFMLMGIVKKNGIMIVDFAIQRVAAGEKPRQSIHDASMDRFRPIMMTTHGRADGGRAHRHGLGDQRRQPPPAGPGHRRRADRQPVAHAVRDAGDLPLPGGGPGESTRTASRSSPPITRATCRPRSWKCRTRRKTRSWRGPEKMGNGREQSSAQRSAVGQVLTCRVV